MAEELGAAVLRVEVRTNEALGQLNDFRNKFSAALADIGKIDLGKADFSGLIQQATQAGAQAGKAITAGIEAATKKTKELKFGSFYQALNFEPKNSIKGLEEYARALQKLRDETSLSVKGTQELTDRLGAIQAALAQARTTTAQATATQREFNNSLEKTRLKRVAEETKQQANALKALEASQRAAVAANEAAAASSRAAAKAAAEQRKAYLDLAKASIGAVGGVASGAAGAASAIGKGAIGAVRTGVKVGRAAYGIGAELGIFEDPKPGIVNAAIQSVIDKFAFLGKQAQTTRGLILRTLEGVGTGAGLIELARNADLLRESLKAVSVTAKATDASVSAFAKFGNYFANSGLGSIGPLKDLFKGFADLETGTAAITSFTDQLIQIGTKGLSGSVDAIDALVNGFGQLPPAAQAAALAAPAVFAVIAGPAGKQAEVQLRKLKALLDGLGTTSLNVEGQLRDALNAIAEQEGILKRAPLALPSSDLLQQRLRDSGSRQPQRLEPGVLNAVNNAGLGIAEQYTRQLEAGARAVKSQRDQYIAVQAEASKLLETDLRRQQILNSIARQRAAAPGFGAASSADFGFKPGGRAFVPKDAQYTLEAATTDPVKKSIRRNQEKVAQEEERAARNLAQQEQDLAAVQQRRKAVQESLLQLEKAEQQAASRRAQAALKQLQDTAVAVQRRRQAEQDFERRLADAQRASQQRATQQAEAQRRQRQEAGSNALIGGAFPLLFGQGLGASIGGAAGGAAGGLLGGQFGFGLSLLGTAVGAAVDTLKQRFTDLTKALEDPVKNIDKLVEQFVFASRAQESYVKALIETGQTAKAALEIQKEASQTIDPAVAALSAAANDRYSRSLSNVLDRLGNITAGPATGFINFLDAVLQRLGGATTGGGQPSITGPRVITDARNTLGRNVGGAIAGGLLAAGGVAALATGAGAPIGVGLIGSGLTMAGIGGFGAANDIQKERIASSRIVAQGEKLITAELTKQLEIQKRLIEAKAAGNDFLAQQATFTQQESQARAAFLQEVQRINVDSAAGNITAAQAGQQQNAALEALRLQQAQIRANRVEYEKGLATAARESERQVAIAKATTGLGREAASITRQRLEFEQRLTDLLKARKTAEANFNAVSAARDNGTASSQDLTNAANAFITAANNVKLAGIDFYNKIVDAAKQARDNLLSASLNRAQQLGNRDQGLNKYLAPSVVDARQFQSAQELKKNLGPVVKQYWSSFSEGTKAVIRDFYSKVDPVKNVGSINGVPVNTYNTPPSQETLNTIADIIQSAKGEQDGKQALIDANNAVVASNQALTSGAQALAALLPNLATIMNNLAGKDWTVNVNVPGGSASGAVIGNVNGGLGR